MNDGENANLVQEDNNDAPENNVENDARRARVEESDEEERNVKPQLIWGVPYPR